MIQIRKISRILTLLLVAFFLLGGQVAALDKTLTVGKVSGAIDATVAVPITINDAAGVGGVAFTITYDPSVFTFMGLEQGGKVITKGDEFLPPPVPPAVYTTEQINLIKTDLFYQANDYGALATPAAPTGRVLVAAASADGLAGTNLVVLNAKFKIKGGNGEYPIGLLRTIIQNAAAGYADPSFLPALVGTSTKNSQTGLYDTTTFPVYPATLIAGSITVNANKFNITGTATYGATNPAANATAVLKRNTPSGYVNDGEAVKIGSDGKYAFNGRLPGTYQVFVISNDPGYYNNQSAVFSVTNANFSVLNIALSAPERLTGSVTLNGGYVAGLQVKVMDGTKVVGVYPVNADGKFQTPPLPPGTYTLYAVYGNLTSPQITGTPLALAWTPTLYSIGGTISGLTGDAAVMASSVKGKLQKTIQVTLPVGSPYSLGNLVPADDYIVSVTASGVPVTYYDGKTDVGQANPVVLNSTSGSKTDANFNFASITQGTISGTVTENSAGANIGVYAFETGGSLTQVNAVSGAYSFTLTPGSYEIFVIMANGKIFYYNGVDATQTEAEATIITLAGGVNASGKNINIIECDNVLTGKVAYKSAGGDPAANVLVTATSTAGKGIALTGQDGTYSLGGLCPGNYLVEMNPLDSKYAVQSVTVSVPAVTAVEPFIINKGYVLSGTITNSADASKVANAMLYLLDQQTGALVNGRMYFSDSSGLYTIADIPDGIYTLNVAHALYRSYSDANLSITADNPAKDIAMVKGAYFNVTVTDGSNGEVALPGALVIVTRSGSVPVYALTDTNGNSKIYGLDASKSDYLILVQKSGYVRQVVKNGATLTWSPTDLGTAVPVSLLKPAALFDLTGKITSDSSGNPPVVGAYVLVSTVAKDFFATTVTDNNGDYSFAKLPQANDYKFVVVPGGGLRTQVQTGLDYTGSTTQTNNVTIPSGVTITGTVTRTGDTPIYVFLYTEGNKFVGYTKADNSTGAYSFTGIVTGNYKVLAVSSGFSSKWSGGAAAIGDAAIVIAGGTADINL